MAVYSDVVQMATDENEAVSLAQQKSIQLMQTHIVEICAKRLHMDKKDVQEIWDVIDDKCQNIVVKKGDLFRVFTYIMKDAIGLGPKKPKPGDIEKYLGPDPETESTAEVTTTDEATAPPPVNEEMQAAITEALAAEETDRDTIQAEVYLSKQEALAATKQEEPTPQAETVKEEPVKEAVVVETPQLVKTMISKGNLTTLMRYLQAEKAKQTLMYGSLNTMQYRERCYIVIVDKTSQQIVAVLDKGTDDRLNFVSGQSDKLVNYRRGNYSAILVQEY
jgi:hypothetical protein